MPFLCPLIFDKITIITVSCSNLKHWSIVRMRNPAIAEIPMSVTIARNQHHNSTTLHTKTKLEPSAAGNMPLHHLHSAVLTKLIKYLYYWLYPSQRSSLNHCHKTHNRMHGRLAAFRLRSGCTSQRRLPPLWSPAHCNNRLMTLSTSETTASLDVATAAEKPVKHTN